MSSEAIGRLQRFHVGANAQKPSVDLNVAGGLVVAGGVSTSGISRNGRLQNTEKTANYTLTAADSGLLFACRTDGVIFTLPAVGAGTVGQTYTFENIAEDGQSGMQLSPNSVDQIIGNGFTAVDNKDAINTKATSKKGDRMRLVSDGANGWFIADVVGTWAREA